MYLVDSNIVSELRKASSGRANDGVVAWAQSVAATAKVHGLCVVTRNIKDFEPFHIHGVRVLNPWI